MGAHGRSSRRWNNHNKSQRRRKQDRRVEEALMRKEEASNTVIDERETKTENKTLLSRVAVILSLCCPSLCNREKRNGGEDHDDNCTARDFWAMFDQAVATAGTGYGAGTWGERSGSVTPDESMRGHGFDGSHMKVPVIRRFALGNDDGLSSPRETAAPSDASDRHIGSGSMNSAIQKAGGRKFRRKVEVYFDPRVTTVDIENYAEECSRDGLWWNKVEVEQMEQHANDEMTAKELARRMARKERVKENARKSLPMANRKWAAESLRDNPSESRSRERNGGMFWVFGG